jgi:mono/diheme cytochrome c family protein
MPRAAVVVLLAVLALAGVAAGCAGEDTVTPAPETVVGDLPKPAEAAPGDPAAGKEVFATAGCASCHALADAGSSATVGPNLDDTKPALELIVDRVTNGQGVMPSFKDQLDDQQIADVAAYVVQATSG